MNSDAISEELNCKTNDSIDVFGHLEIPKDRSGSSETVPKQEDDQIYVEPVPTVNHQHDGLSVNSSNKKEIEPEDNIEQDGRSSSGSDFDYETELDTDEYIGNHFNTSSNNNSFENQERMLGSFTTPHNDSSVSKARVSGGIKCLRNLRRNGKALRKRGGGRKKKTAGVISQIHPSSKIKVQGVIVTETTPEKPAN